MKMLKMELLKIYFFGYNIIGGMRWQINFK